MDNGYRVIALSPEWGVFIKPLPSRLRGLCRRRGRRGVRDRGGSHSKETVSSNYKRTGTHMNLQRQHTQDLHSFKPDKNPRLVPGAFPRPSMMSRLRRVPRAPT